MSPDTKVAKDEMKTRARTRTGEMGRPAKKGTVVPRGGQWTEAVGVYLRQVSVCANITRIGANIAIKFTYGDDVTGASAYLGEIGG